MRRDRCDNYSLITQEVLLCFVFIKYLKRLPNQLKKLLVDYLMSIKNLVNICMRTLSFLFNSLIFETLGTI